MHFIHEISKAIRATLLLWLLTGLVYPLVMLGIGQLAFPVQANGSLLTNAQGNVVGSALIGQPFVSDRYFNSRPSAIDYSTADPHQDHLGILQTGVSGASNLAPSNPALIQRIEGTIAQWKPAGIEPTADLVYSSGSGLDPHITPAAARVQIPRIAQVRHLPPEQLEDFIRQNTDDRFLEIFGEPGVNVLKLNLALDAASAHPSS
jgi:K+-transporting ATPase ATPase C chain